MYQRVARPRASVADHAGPTHVAWRAPVDTAAPRAVDQLKSEALRLRRGHDFSRISVHAQPQDLAVPSPIRAAPVQRQPIVGFPEDRSECEADRFADELLAGRPAGTGPTSPGYSASLSGWPLAEDRVGQVRAVLTGGEPLPGQVRGRFGQAVGMDLGAVRVHAGPRAAQAAAALDARSFTWGTHVVFGAGQYEPKTRAGLHLLAHELAHVAQQGAAGQSMIIQRQPGTQWMRQGSPTPVAKSASNPPVSAKAQNPTYVDAELYIERYFRRQGELDNQLDKIRDYAFRKFQEVTGEAFNAESDVGGQLLLVVLSAIPEAGPLLKVLKEVEAIRRVKSAAEIVEKAAKTVEKIEVIKAGVKPVLEGREALHKGKEVEEKRESASETLDIIEEQAKGELKGLTTRWQKEDDIRKELKGRRYAPPGHDLEAEVAGKLGPVPNAQGIDQVAAAVQKKYLLELLRDHYVKAGAYWDRRDIWTGHGVFGKHDYIVNISAAALKEIMTVGGFADNSQIAKAWNLREDHDLDVPIGVGYRR